MGIQSVPKYPPPLLPHGVVSFRAITRWAHLSLLIRQLDLIQYTRKCLADTKHFGGKYSRIH